MPVLFAAFCFLTKRQNSCLLRHQSVCCLLGHEKVFCICSFWCDTTESPNRLPYMRNELHNLALLSQVHPSILSLELGLKVDGRCYWAGDKADLLFFVKYNFELSLLTLRHQHKQWTEVCRGQITWWPWVAQIESRDVFRHCFALFTKSPFHSLWIGRWKH